MTVCLNYEPEMLRNLKALYKYTDRFLTIFPLVRDTERDRDRQPETERHTERQKDRDRDCAGERSVIETGYSNEMPLQQINSCLCIPAPMIRATQPMQLLLFSSLFFFHAKYWSYI